VRNSLSYENSSFHTTFPNDDFYECNRSSIDRSFDSKLAIKDMNENFGLQTAVTPSVGLRYVILPVVSNYQMSIKKKGWFDTNKNEKEFHELDQNRFYRFLSIPGNDNDFADTMYPTKPNKIDVNSVGNLGVPFLRPAAIIRSDSHNIWKQNNLEELKSWMQNHFPQLPKKLSDFIPDDALKRMLNKTSIGTFPSHRVVKNSMHVTQLNT
jgi:hypothetical protein